MKMCELTRGEVQFILDYLNYTAVFEPLDEDTLNECISILEPHMNYNEPIGEVNERT